MRCRYCSRELPENALFCCWCGKKQLQEKGRGLRVPAPRQLPSGRWNIVLRREGQSITEDSPELCTTRALAVRAGFLEASRSVRITLSSAIDSYIASRTNTLSPSTIRGYREIQRLRFHTVMTRPLSSITDWQAVVNAEARTCSPKTLKNAWGFIHSVLSSQGISVTVSLPSVPRSNRPWLTPEEILVFLDAIRGKPGELAALLALHSLRRSELLALTWSQVSPSLIRVSGSVVSDEHNMFVSREANKTLSSARTVPVMIPRLGELLASPGEPEEHLISSHPNIPGRQINRVCAAASLPLVGVHGLRHSFASLGYHLRMSEMEVMRLGGWSDYTTVHRIYTHLSDLDALKASNKMADFYENANDFTNDS